MKETPEERAFRKTQMQRKTLMQRKTQIRKTEMRKSPKSRKTEMQTKNEQSSPYSKGKQRGMSPLAMEDSPKESPVMRKTQFKFQING